MREHKIIRGSAAEHKYLGNRDTGVGARLLSALRRGDEIRKLKERIAELEGRLEYFGRLKKEVPNLTNQRDDLLERFADVVDQIDQVCMLCHETPQDSNDHGKNEALNQILEILEPPEEQGNE